MRHMKRFHKPQVLIYILIVCVALSTSIDVDNLVEFYKSLMSDHVPFIRPVKNQSAPITVSIDIALHSVVSYEETTGTLSSLVILHKRWNDELVKTNFSEDVVTNIPIPTSLVWSPVLRIYNTVTEDTGIKMGDSKFQTVFLTPNGTMEWTVMGLTVTKCKANMLYYPMDEQKCEIIFMSAESFENVKIQTFSQTFTDRSSALIENDEWDIKHVMSKTGMYYTYPTITLSFNICRRPMFLLMNFVAPLVYLCILNILVFLLPESSGERISYSVTMLLTLTLYLNMIADRLPNTVPVSLININIIIQYNTSCFVVLMTILTVWMYNKQQGDQPVPRCWQTFMWITHCVCFRRLNSKVRQISPQSEKDFELKEVDDVITEGGTIEVVPVTWGDVTQSTNQFLFRITVVFLCIQILVFFLLTVIRFV